MGDLTKKIVRYGAIAVGIIFLVIVVLRFGKAFTSFQTDMSDADLRIANYQKEIMSENAKLEEADNALEASKAGVYSMKDPGTAVAVLQTKMVTMPVSINQPIRPFLMNSPTHWRRSRQMAATIEFFLRPRLIAIFVALLIY